MKTTIEYDPWAILPGYQWKFTHKDEHAIYYAAPGPECTLHIRFLQTEPSFSASADYASVTLRTGVPVLIGSERAAAKIVEFIDSINAIASRKVLLAEVARLKKAITKSWIVHPAGGYYAYCNLCGERGESDDGNDILHKPGCIVPSIVPSSGVGGNE